VINKYRASSLPLNKRLARNLLPCKIRARKLFPACGEIKIRRQIRRRFS
jgi:hypothetical protein